MPKAKLEDVALEHRWNGPDGAPVVMFSNSFVTNYCMWDLQIDELVDAGFRALRYDSRGMGACEVPAGPYSMQQVTGDAAELMDHLCVERVDFCGLSAGAMVIQR